MNLHLEELRRVLLEERDQGTLTRIPVDLYLRTMNEIKTIQQEVYAFDDPFSDEARMLIEKVASIRATIEETFKIRTEKIVSLAQNHSEGTHVDREELKTLIPAELEMFNKVVDAIQLCRSSLVEWRTTIIAPAHCPIPATRPSEQDETGEEPYEEDTEIARAEEWEKETAPAEKGQEREFPYALVQVKMEMEPFMGLDGLTYNLVKGDIVTLPRRNADVLIERDIVLNINQG